MYIPVDLANLRDMTGGDKDVETMLFGEFFKSAQACIHGLEQLQGSDQNDAWRKQAHAFKGISLNMGANQLSALCKQAQDGCTMPADGKQALLISIKSEYELVKKFLEENMP